MNEGIIALAVLALIMLGLSTRRLIRDIKRHKEAKNESR